MRRIRRIFRSMSAFVAQLSVALIKAVITSALLGAFAVIIMHYMGVQVPSADDLLRGVSRLGSF
jgi:hypothetical protein